LTSDIDIDHFISACTSYYYGANCAFKCKCVEANSVYCDPSSGLCGCKKGWKGTFCDVGM